MYIIYRNIWSKNLALYNIKNYINHKNTITVSITIFQIHSLRLRCDQLPLQASQSFKLSHYKRELSVSDIKKKQAKKNKISYS